MTSETSEITVYRRVKYLPHVYPELNLEINLVDIPGLDDSSEGGDQRILDMMKEQMRMMRQVVPALRWVPAIQLR